MCVNGCFRSALVLRTGLMHLKIGETVMHPAYQPYPRYGRVLKAVDDEQVLVTNVQCGDPRCAAEHHHEDVVWRTAEVVSDHAYQARAEWEEGRKSSPNAVIAEEES
jgi:hypothetical protein